MTAQAKPIGERTAGVDCFYAGCTTLAKPTPALDGSGTLVLWCQPHAVDFSLHCMADRQGSGIKTA